MRSLWPSVVRTERRYSQLNLDPFDDGVDPFDGDTIPDVQVPLGMLPPGFDERETLLFVRIEEGTIIGPAPAPRSAR